MNRELIAIVDSGGGRNQLLARRVREMGVFCRSFPRHFPKELEQLRPKGGIVTTIRKKAGGKVFAAWVPLLDFNLSVNTLKARRRAPLSV